MKSVQIRSFFWSVLSRICTQYGEILRISPYSVRIRESMDQKTPLFRHVSRSVNCLYSTEVFNEIWFIKEVVFIRQRFMNKNFTLFGNRFVVKCIQWNLAKSTVKNHVSRGVFRTHSNFYKVAFLRIVSNLFSNSWWI